MKQEYFYLYRIINLINGKIYVGIHKTKNLNDGYMGSGKALKHAIKKYGIENFKKEILDFFSSWNLLREAEAYIVNEDFVKRKDTYNMCLGGANGWEDVNRAKLNVYGKNGHVGYGGENLINGKDLKEKLIHEDRFDEWKNKISISLKSTWSKNGHPWTGKHHSEETKHKIGKKNSKNRTGPKNIQYGRVRCIQTNAENCKNHVGYFPDQIPEGWITTKEWKEKNKKKKISRIETEKYFEKEKNNKQIAEYWYTKFLNSGCKSLREFVKISDYTYSVVTLSALFKKYIEGYNPIQGKPYNKDLKRDSLS